MFVKFLSIIAAAIVVLYGARTLLASTNNEMIVGKATVIDGNTFDIGRERVRLHGVDAPEVGQLCDFQGKKWLCGSKAALDLAEWMGQATIVCRRRESSHDRTVASCMKGAVDVAGWMVSQRLAVAETCYSRSYVAEQESARTAQVGIWALTFMLPTVWRHEQQKRPGPPPASC